MVNSYPIRVSDSIDDIRQCMIRTPVRSKGLPLDLKDRSKVSGV